MPITRSQSRAPATLQVPNRRSCRLRTKISPLSLQSKPELLHLAAVDSLTRPSATHRGAQSAALPFPRLLSRFPLRPRKRTGKSLQTGKLQRQCCSSLCWSPKGKWCIFSGKVTTSCHWVHHWLMRIHQTRSALKERKITTKRMYCGLTPVVCLQFLGWKKPKSKDRRQFVCRSEEGINWRVGCWTRVIN